MPFSVCENGVMSRTLEEEKWASFWLTGNKLQGLPTFLSYS